MRNRICFLTTLFIVMLFGCVPSENEGMDLISEQDFTFTFHRLSNQDVLNHANLLQTTVNISDEVQFSTFGEVGADGFGGSFDKIYLYDKESNTESVLLLDENKSPAFLYNVDLANGKKLESLAEFETIENNRFYLRFYHYDWNNRIGTLLFETEIALEGDSFVSTPTFETENLDFTGKPSTVRLKYNKSFAAPIARLDSFLQKSGKTNTNKSEDLVGDWIIDLEKFRNSDVVEFLNIAKGTGLTGAALGATAVLLGSTAGAPLLIGGAGLAAASRATQFFISDEFEDFVNDKLRNIENFADNAVDGAIEIIDGYATDLESLQSWLNTNVSETNLDSVLGNMEANEIIVENEDLDDLPRPTGVLHFALSWNTSRTDIDLYVTDPSGQTIYYANPSSTTGGYLDRDDTDGFGPENIYWTNNIPEGVYHVSVNYFGCDDEPSCPTTSYTIKISNGLGFVGSYSGTLSTVGQTNQVVDFGYSPNEF